MPPVSGCWVTGPGTVELVVVADLVVAVVPGAVVVVVATDRGTVVPAGADVVLVVVPTGPDGAGPGAGVVVTGMVVVGMVVVGVVVTVVAGRVVVVVAPGPWAVVRVSSPRLIRAVEIPATSSRKMSTKSAMALLRRTAIPRARGTERSRD